MTFNRKLAAATFSVTLTLGLTAAAFAQTTQTTQTTQTPSETQVYQQTQTTQTPSATQPCQTTNAPGATETNVSQTTGATPEATLKSNVNIDASAIDNDNPNFGSRIKAELIDKPAPQTGETRAAIEAIYGPARTDLAPNKDYEVYTNEYDLVEGKMFQRRLTPGGLRIYQVSYTGSQPNRSANDKATNVVLRTIPQVGDHRNLVNKMMGGLIVSRPYTQHGNQAFYEIPQQRYVYYNDILSSPFEAANLYFNSDGYLVGQEFVSSRYKGQQVRTSAGRSIELESVHQPDVKIGTMSGD